MKKQEFKGLQKLNVIQSNVITRSAQGLSLVEKRILWTALAGSKGIKTNEAISFSAKDYTDTFELENLDVAYRELKIACKTFMSRSFTIPVTYYSEKRKKILPSKRHYNWLSYVEYKEQEAIVKVKFNPDITELLFELTEQFTKYQLKQASALRSLYSWRLLELFEQMRKSLILKKDEQGNTSHSKKDTQGWLKIDIEDFCNAMEAPKTYRSNFKDLRINVIEPAIKELKEKDDWKIEFKAIKYGRKYKTLSFKFEKNKQQKLEF